MSTLSDAYSEGYAVGVNLPNVICTSCKLHACSFIHVSDEG